MIAVATFFSWETIVGAQVGNKEAEAAARKARESFMPEWNTGDDARLRTTINFPL